MTMAIMPHAMELAPIRVRQIFATPTYASVLPAAV